MIDPDVVKRLQALADQHGLKVIDIDNRPWGGEFWFDEAQVEQFAAVFYPSEEVKNYISRLAQPKFLVIAPHQRFSWQYHRHRGEWWRIVEGPVGLISSVDDKQGPVKNYLAGDLIFMNQGMRHRFVGLDGWGATAELWINRDPSTPSTEEDNVRLEDDYGRKGIS